VNPIEVHRRAVVPIPADVLWQLIEPAEAQPAWLPLGWKCERLGGDGLGREQRLYAKWSGKAAEIDQRVTGYVPNEVLEWTHVAERIDGKPAPIFSRDVRISIELKSVGAGTQVTLRSSQRPVGPLCALLVRFIGARRVARAFDRAFLALSVAGG
jgi:hypothetical protein